MYNLFIGYSGPEDLDDFVEVDESRFLEYTDDETKMRFRDLSGDATRTIKKYPALFMKEGYASGAFVGHITSIRLVKRSYKVSFRKDDNIGVVSPEVIETAALELRIKDSFEFHRTHWAVKQGDLLDILARNKITGASEESADTDEPANKPADDDAGFNKSQVFIVHGHDDHAKADAKEYVESRGLEAIILHLQANGGQTIIEKIESYSNVGFSIVLYTECDVGAKRDSLKYSWRARQNVVFEHGFLIAKLSRSRVAALLKGSVETPNDISGVVYVRMDAAKKWHKEMDQELKQAGYTIKES